MAKLQLTYAELAALILSNPDLPANIRGVSPDVDGILLNIRPLRIAPALNVPMTIGHLEDGKLHCPFKVEKHLHWVLRHVVTPRAEDLVTIVDHSFVFDVSGILREYLPGVNVLNLEKLDGGCMVEFCIRAPNGD